MGDRCSGLLVDDDHLWNICAHSVDARLHSKSFTWMVSSDTATLEIDIIIIPTFQMGKLRPRKGKGIVKSPPARENRSRI